MKYLLTSSLKERSMINNLQLYKIGILGGFIGSLISITINSKIICECEMKGSSCSRSNNN